MSSRLLPLRSAMHDRLRPGEAGTAPDSVCWRAPHHDQPGSTVLSRRTVTEDRDSWLELLETRDADATIWDVVVACPECGMRQDFRGTDAEIGEAAEAWKKGHQCAAPG